MGTTSDKLTYLNTTKTKIKDAINLANTNITNETFRQYESKIKQALINTMNDKWGTWDNFEKVIGTGETLNLNPTSEAPMKIDLKGNTSQYTTTGKNLAIYNSATFGGYSVYIDSSSTDEKKKWYDIITTLPKDTTLIGNWDFKGDGTPTANISGLIVKITYSDNTSQNITKGESFTISNSKTISYLNVFGNSSSTTNTWSNIQFERGSQVTSYEPYTGGNPAPNPTYPQPVNVVTGDNEVNVVGKNFFNIGTSTSDYVNPSNAIKSISNNTINVEIKGSGGTFAYRNQNLSGNKTYTISSIFSIKYGRYFIRLRKLDDSGWLSNSDVTISGWTYNSYYGGWYVELVTKETPLTPQITIDIPNCLYWQIGFGFQTTTIGNIETISNTQIELGNQKTDYIPYQTPQTYPIYLGVENLFDGVFRQGTHVNTSTANCLCSDNEMKSVSGKQYTFYTNLPNTFKYKIMNCTANGTSTTVINDTSYSTSGSVSVNCTANGYLKILVKNNDDSDLTPSTITGYTFQVGIGTNHVYNQPIELCKIGDYQDELLKSTGKNLFDGEIELGSINPDDGTLSSSTTRTRSKNYIKVQPNTTYYFKRQNGLNRWVIGYTSSKVGITDGNYSGHASALMQIAPTEMAKSFTTSPTTEYIKWYDTNDTDLTEKVMISLEDIPFEPYGTQWYIHKEIGKVVLDGSETWYRWTANTFYITKLTEIRNALSNYYTYNSTATGAGQLNNGEFFIHDSLNNYVVIFKNTGINDSIDSFKTWLSTHNTTVYYILATPTNTIITDTELIGQLDNIQGAMSYTGQTNIMQVPYDKPFIITTTALKAI